MPPKRKRGKQYAGPAKKKYKYEKSQWAAVRTIQAVVRRTLQKNMETKHANHTSTDDMEIGHNNFIIVDGNVLETTQGVGDSMAGMQNRMGDEISLKGVRIKLMMELNESYSDVTYRLFLVKKVKGPRNFATTGSTSGTGAGNYIVNTSSSMVLSRATKIVKIWIPGTKFNKSGKMVYENGTSQPKFFDYRLICFAYANWSTSDALGYNVGRLNDCVRQIAFTEQKNT